MSILHWNLVLVLLWSLVLVKDPDPIGVHCSLLHSVALRALGVLRVERKLSECPIPSKGATGSPDSTSSTSKRSAKTYGPSSRYWCDLRRHGYLKPSFSTCSARIRSAPVKSRCQITFVRHGTGLASGGMGISSHRLACQGTSTSNRNASPSFTSIGPCVPHAFSRHVASSIISVTRTTEKSLLERFVSITATTCRPWKSFVLHKTLASSAGRLGTKASIKTNAPNANRPPSSRLRMFVPLFNHDPNRNS